MPSLTRSRRRIRKRCQEPNTSLAPIDLINCDNPCNPLSHSSSSCLSLDQCRLAEISVPKLFCRPFAALHTSSINVNRFSPDLFLEFRTQHFGPLLFLFFGQD